MDRRRTDGRTVVMTKTLAEWPAPEVFFLTALRYWLSGYETGDVDCWELAWQGASKMLPLDDAKRTMAEVGYFTRVLRSTLEQRFMFLPYCCGRFTQEEQLATLLVSAAQRGEIAAAGGFARRLTGNNEHCALVDAALDLARALEHGGMRLTLGDASAADDRRRHLH
jgi:hypothetical protein